VSWLLKPADLVLGRLPLQLRILLLVTLPLIPLVWTVAAYASTQGERINFATQEQVGVAYERPAIGLLVAVDSAWDAARLGTQGPTLNAALSSFQQAERDYGADLKTGDVAAAAVTAVQALVDGKLPSSDSRWSAASDAVLAVTTAAANNSNLILDPDLDSFYVMDAGVVRIPALVDGAAVTGEAATSGKASTDRTANVAVELGGFVAAGDGFAGDVAIIAMDRRGVGLSDRLSPQELPPAEVLVSDVLAVLDEVRSTDTVIMGLDEGAQVAALFAATHPKRASHLILHGISPSGVPRPDMPWVVPHEDVEEWLQWSVARYGTRDQAVTDAQQTSPSRADDEAYLAWLAALYRNAASPSSFLALYRMTMHLDVTDVLSAVQTPTLAIHNSGDLVVPLAAAEFVAQRIPNATLHVMPYEDHFLNAAAVDDYVEVILEFIGAPRTELDANLGRRLATIVFTDIVDSTVKATELGDVAWKALVERHHVLVRDRLVQFGGREVDTAGDGFFMTFDGPAAAVRCAAAIVEDVRSLGVGARAGVHTGEVETIAGKAGGIAVVIGARIGALAAPGEVLTSQTVRDLTAGSGIVFTLVGERELKGLPDLWRVYQAQTA